MLPVRIKHRVLDESEEFREEGVCHIRAQVFDKHCKPLREVIVSHHVLHIVCYSMSRLGKAYVPHLLNSFAWLPCFAKIESSSR